MVSNIFFRTLTLLFVFMVSFAAIPVRQSSMEKQDIYLDNGVFVGGKDRGEVTLFNVRFSSQKSVERLVFDVGTGEPDEIGRSCFFHISLQRKNKRIVADLQNVVQTKVTAIQVMKALTKSQYIKQVSYYPDTRQKHFTIEMALKKDVQMEVFELATHGKVGRIVIDIKPL